MGSGPDCLMWFRASGDGRRGLLIENPVGFQHGLSRSAGLPLYFRFLFTGLGPD